MSGTSGAGEPPVEPMLDCDALCAGAGLRCHRDACVECTEDRDCYASGRRCETLLHRCVVCRDNNDCAKDQDCASYRCLQTCATPSRPTLYCIDAARTCDEERSRCIACRDNVDCEGSSDGPVCLPNGVGCGECRKDEDCDPSLKCDQVEFKCVLCRDSSDCAVGAVCDPKSHTCFDPRLPGPFTDPGRQPF